MNQTERRRFLIDALLDERPEYRGARVPVDGEEQRLLLRALMNVRTARKCSPEFLRVQDEYLRAEQEPLLLSVRRNARPTVFRTLVQKRVYEKTPPFGLVHSVFSPFGTIR